MLRLSLLTLVGASLLSVSPARSQETDPYAGTFSDGNLTVTLIRSESGFNGKARVPEGEFSIAAQRMGNRLVGTYTIDGTEFLFQASLRGDVLILTAEGRTFTLERQSPAAETATGASRGNPPAAGRDTQLTQLLLSSRWCHFSYRGSSNNTGSGTSHQESVTFNRDGTAQVQTGGEN